LLAVLLWGGIYPAAAFSLREMPLLAFTALRILLALAVLAACTLGPVRPAVAGLPRLLVRAGLAQAAFQLLLVAGVAFTTAGVTALLVATAPLMTAVWSAVTGRERLSRARALGLGLGVAGVVLLVRPMLGLGSNVVLGGALALGAAAAWCWYSLAIEPLARRLGAIRATALSMAIAAVVVTPVAMSELVRLTWRDVSGPAWLGLAYGAVGGMTVATVLWGHAVQRLGAVTTMVYAYLEPVFAVVLSAWLLGERIAFEQLAGGGVVLGAVWLAAAPAEPGP
jgi:drug/metabolite transporter (DMT)-like permease